MLHLYDFGKKFEGVSIIILFLPHQNGPRNSLLENRFSEFFNSQAYHQSFSGKHFCWKFDWNRFSRFRFFSRRFS